MRVIKPAIWALFIAVGLPFVCANAIADELDKYMPEEVLVIVSDNAGEDINQIGAMVGGAVQQQISFPHRQHHKRHKEQTQPSTRRVLRVKLPKGASVEQVISEQWPDKDRRIIRVEPNYKLRIASVPNDPRFSSMWALRNTGQTGGTANADIDAVPAWDITVGSDSVIVAVIDTGIDYLHPDLVANIWTNTDEIPGNGVDDDRNGYIDDVHGYNFVNNSGNPLDDYGHGTHCAGTIGAQGNNGVGVTGINWRCKLMACKFLGNTGSGSLSDAIRAINYAVENGADILSNSWGGGDYSLAMAEAITNAKEHGVLFVAAAGNASANNDVYPEYPSGYAIENVIAVAATDHSDALAWFSNYGLHSVHLAAPGVEILSTIPDGQYDWFSGTSMATPHVAGVAALLLAHNPAMTLCELKSRLIQTGDQIPSLSTKTISGRRLNAYNALTAQPGLTVISPNSQVTWVQEFDRTIQWTSIGGGETVNIYLLKAGSNYLQLANGVANTGTFSWHIPNTVAVGSDYRVWIDDGVNTDQSDANFTISDTAPDYFTELFSGSTGRFDLSNKSLTLIPDGSASGYAACLDEITELPVNPEGSTDLSLRDDDSKAVTLTGHSVKLYGSSYYSFYVGSNGFITFGGADVNYEESLSKHFRMKRVAALFRDLDPTESGKVEKKELDDRVVVTWEDVSEYSYGNSNTFQIEMFYEGRIRLSWLSIASQYGMVGISEGLGTPSDFQQSDVSGYTRCNLRLESIEVSGPSSASEQSSAQFTCLANYENGSTRDVTAEVNWSDNSDYATVDNNGRLTTEDVNDYLRCTVTAAFEGKSDNNAILITSGITSIVSIQQCTVKAGKTAGLDSIVCSGGFGATAGQFAEANNVAVRIYSAADDYLVYEQVIDMNLFALSRNVYSYKYKLRSGQPGGITSLSFDTRKAKFSLQAANIDLTGLACPVYVIIDIGAYACLGVADETIVNGRDAIPIRLMSGYADTLAVTKTQVKTSSKPLNDRLIIKGTLTLADDANISDGLTITWGQQSFTVPGGQFSLVNTGVLRSRYYAPDGTIIFADFDLNKCTLSIDIKHITITSRSGNVDFGLSFGNYDKSAEVRL